MKHPGTLLKSLLFVVAFAIALPQLSPAAQTQACPPKKARPGFGPFFSGLFKKSDRGPSSRPSRDSRRVMAGATVRLSDVYGGAIPISKGSAVKINGMEMRSGVASRFGQGVGNPGGRSAFTNENLKAIGAGSGPLHTYCAVPAFKAGYKSAYWANKPILVIHGNRAIVCRAVDKGPYTKGRVLDMSKNTAELIGIGRKQGIGKVTMALARPGIPVGVPFFISQ
jgi:hypothetical protein